MQLKSFVEQLERQTLRLVSALNGCRAEAVNLEHIVVVVIKEEYVAHLNARAVRNVFDLVRSATRKMCDGKARTVNRKGEFNRMRRLHAKILHHLS